MPNISIADGFGLNVQASPNNNSAFAKYFKQLPSFSAIQHDLASLQDVPLTGIPVNSTKIGLNFSAPTTLVTSGSQFGGSAAVSGVLNVVKDGKLFDPDPYGNPIDVPGGCAFLELGILASLAPEVDITSGKITFGFAAGTTVRLSHFQLFPTTATTPTFRSALQESLQDYVIPFAPEDLSALGVGDVAVIEGTGSFQVSGSFNLLTSVNPLVSVTTPVIPVTLQVQEGAAITVSACCTITGEIQIRVQKVDGGTVRLGLYRKRGAEFTIQVNPSVGITAGTSSSDFISPVLGTIGSSPFPSAEEMEKAGLTAEKQDAINDALKAAIQRKLELSILEELHAGSAQEAAFIYDISLKDLGADGRTAVQQALRLNLSALSDSAQPLPAGIREVQSLITSTRKKGQSLKLNLLGIYNFTSVSDLTLKGTVLADPASGEVVITDSTTATRVSGAVNFLADSDKLRKALGQSFLITAAYRCSGVIPQAPSLKVSYWHFDEQARTNLSTMAADLNVLTSMGMLAAADAQQRLAATQDFGRSTFYLTTDYDDALAQGLFLQNDGQARSRDEFERLGRDSMQLLLASGNDNAYRLRALQDAVWPQVRETGGTPGNLSQLFPDLDPVTQIPIIAGDYVVIAWWATTMARMAQSLSTAKRLLSQDPPPATNSPAFKKLQADLWRQMTDVAANTHDRFSEPWGVLAMDLASGKRSAASGRIVSPGLTLNVTRT